MKGGASLFSSQMKVRQASPTKKWNRDLTEQHDEVFQDLYQTIEGVSNGEEFDPRAIVGAYGSGKTQLLYEAFRIAWQDIGIPALYTDAGSILSDYRSDVGDDPTVGIKEWLSEEIQNQVSEASEGQIPDWLPRFSPPELKEEWFEENIKGSEFNPDSTCILLVDEVEQAYDELQKQIDVDDDSTLRGLLDDVEGVYQIWSFGLVSAYEILGEADVRRFKELRVPVLDPEDVYSILNESDKPTHLAPGLWWLARGRAGWVNKFVDEVPTEPEEILDWFERVSDYDFFGTNPVDQSIITDELSGQSEDWPSARKTVLLMENGYKEWEIESDVSVSSESAANTLTNILISNVELSSKATRIIERNLDLVLRAISTNRWRSDNPDEIESRLPITLFGMDREINAILSLLNNQITSLEPRSAERGNALERLRQVTTKTIREKWMSTSPPTNSIAVSITRPRILQQAYPSIAVDPSVLTSEDTSDLIQKSSEPIQIDPHIRAENIDLSVSYCPTENTFQDAVESSIKLDGLNSCELLIHPDTSEARSWDKPTVPDILTDQNHIRILPRGSSQLRNFTLHLQSYLKSEDGEYPLITEETIQNALSSEDSRKIIDTVLTLWEQLKRIVRNASKRSRNEFHDTYSLRSDDDVLWAKPDLRGKSPFWHYGRSSVMPQIGLSYTLAVAESKFTGGEPYSDLPEEIERAYDIGLVDHTDFRFKGFLELIFSVNGYREGMASKREEFGTTGGSPPDPALAKVQSILNYEIERKEFDRKDLIDSLTDIDTSWDDLNIFPASTFEYAQAEALLWGLLLDFLARSETEYVSSKLREMQSNINRLSNDVNQALSHIKSLNNALEPPNELGETIVVETEHLENYLDNLEGVTDRLELLGEEMMNKPEQASLGVVLFAILQRYSPLAKKKINGITNELYNNDSLQKAESLKSYYTSVRKRINEEQHLFDHTSLESEEFLKELSNVGDHAFNYYSPIGTKTLSVEDIDSLKDVEEHADNGLSIIQEISRKVNELDSIQQERMQIQESSIKETHEFLDMVGEGT